MRKIFFLIVISLFLPFFVLAQNSQDKNDRAFKAEVIEIVEEKDSQLPGGSRTFQQNIKLKGLEGEYEAKEIFFEGISDFALIGSRKYKEGDRVMMVASSDDQGKTTFYITDYVRSGAIFWLSLIFVLTLLIVGKNKGLRAILSLALTFLVVIYFIVPKALSGGSIVLSTLIGSIFILGVVVYLTEGFRVRSHIAMASLAVSLLITVIISWIFVEISKLSGLASEDVAHLVNVGRGVVNFKGLLFSGIMIGTLGVMDDVVISQIAAVEQIYEANKGQTAKELFKRSFEVGTSHISSMTNTLFLAYAGASLPLLILFVSGESAFSSFSHIINNEAIATEIVRTLTGSIGLILAVPISTFLAVWVYKSHNA
ncbi:hypothetical protein GF382_02565 [Candidatus Falkowbacteria bacterium]|nr:hypothetical protein [Candidatus Falkowbacteria bacterium]